MHLYEDQFSQNHDFPRVNIPTKTLIIASTARCGSHMLGHALHETNSFGFPLEYANSSNLSEWKKRLGISDFQDVMTELQRRRTSPSGVFGIKLHYSHIKQFGGFNDVVKLFPDAHYVFLSRKDILKQAVSLSIATQTGVWVAGQTPVNDNPVYDFGLINKCLRETILQNSSWKYTLVASGCNYIEMDFEHVHKNLVHSIERIGGFMDIIVDHTKIPKEQVTKKQSKDLNTEWAMKFLSEFNKSEELLSSRRGSVVHKFKLKVKRMLQV